MGGSRHAVSWCVISLLQDLWTGGGADELLRAANRRYLEFLSSLDDWSAGLKNLDHVTRSVQKGTRTYGGFNPLRGEDRLLFKVLARGEFNISGFQNRVLRRCLGQLSGPQVCRLLKRLRTHGGVKKIGRTYKY